MNVKSRLWDPMCSGQGPTTPGAETPGRCTSLGLALFMGNRDEQTHLSGVMSNAQHSVQVPGQQEELMVLATWLG